MLGLEDDGLDGLLEGWLYVHEQVNEVAKPKQSDFGT